MGRHFEQDLQEFLSLKQLVEQYEMQGFIAEKHVEWKQQKKELEQSGKEQFGKDAEVYVLRTANKYRPDVKFTRTTKEYDYVYGADFKVNIDGMTCYCDLKTAMVEEVVKCKYFLDKNRSFRAKFDDFKFLRITPQGVRICLGIRYFKAIEQGKIIYRKPVLVPIIFGDTTQETVETKEFIDALIFVLKIGMNYLRKRQYPTKALRSFLFEEFPCKEDSK